MDYVQIEKLQAMKKYKKKTQFFQDCIMRIAIVFLLGVFCSIPTWFPFLYSTINLLFMSISNLRFYVFDPKYLFFLCNLIVIFLVGESKRTGNSSSPASEIYDEYVRRNKCLRKAPTYEPQIRETHTDKKFYENEVPEKENIVGIEDNEEEEEEYVDDEEEENGDSDDEFGLPAEELNKRVEDFIAKVNNQMMNEAKLIFNSS